MVENISSQKIRLFNPRALWSWRPGYQWNICREILSSPRVIHKYFHSIFSCAYVTDVTPVKMKRRKVLRCTNVQSSKGKKKTCENIKYKRGKICSLIFSQLVFFMFHKGLEKEKWKHFIFFCFRCRKLFFYSEQKRKRNFQSEWFLCLSSWNKSLIPC